MDKQLKKKLKTYMHSLLLELHKKRMSPDEMLKSIKYEFFTSYPDEFEHKGKMYNYVLETFRGLFEKILYQKDEIAIINNEIIVKDGKDLTYGEIEELLGRGFLNGEMFHKINTELEKLEDNLEDKNWVGVFHSQEHYEAFKHILESFEIEEQSKTLFSGFWYEFGGNRKLIRCTAKKYTEWVYKHYLPNEEKKSENLTRSHCGYGHQFRIQIRRYKATYKDQSIFLAPHQRYI